MNAIRFFFLWMIVALVMFISWALGSTAGNLTTDSTPPEMTDAGAAGSAFVLVCLFNSLLLSVFFWRSASYSGWVKWLSLILYFFGIQFLLTQMETLLFAGSMSISPRQVASILIAGAFMSVMTGAAGIFLSGLMSKRKERKHFAFQILRWKEMITTVCVLAFVVYPFLYMFFGYFVAWQYEAVRIFYSGSPELRPFFSQVLDSFANGIYPFQVLRGFLWIALSLPVVLLLKRWKVMQYILIGLTTALLPATLLFIPNPYMPSEIAMAHFMETSLSNLVWGMSIVYAINRLILNGVLKANVIPEGEKPR